MLLLLLPPLPPSRRTIAALGSPREALSPVLACMKERASKWRVWEAHMALVGRRGFVLGKLKSIPR